MYWYPLEKNFHIAFSSFQIFGIFFKNWRLKLNIASPAERPLQIVLHEIDKHLDQKISKEIYTTFNLQKFELSISKANFGISQEIHDTKLFFGDLHFFKSMILLCLAPAWTMSECYQVTLAHFLMAVSLKVSLIWIFHFIRPQ